MAAWLGSVACGMVVVRGGADEPKPAGDEDAGSRSGKKAESKTDASCAYDDKASAGVGGVVVEEEHGGPEEEEDDAGLNAEEDAAEGGAGLVLFDGDGFEEAAAGLVGGEGGEGVGGVDALQDFFLEAGFGFGDEVTADGREDNPDDEADCEGDKDAGSMVLLVKPKSRWCSLCITAEEGFGLTGPARTARGFALGWDDGEGPRG